MDYRNAGRWFGILDRRSQAYIAAACEKLQLTFSEYVLLCNLFDNEGLRQEDMAALMAVDKAVIARTIKLLEAKGFAERLPGEQDRREKRLYATVAGRQQEAFLRAVLRRWIDYLTGGLEPAAVDSLLAGFEQLAQRAQAADLTQLCGLEAKIGDGKS